MAFSNRRLNYYNRPYNSYYYSHLYLMPPSVQAQLAPHYKLPYIHQQQAARLEKAFETNKNPNETDIAILAMEIGLPEDQVRTWFEHRLACWRQTQGLPANETTVAGY